MTDDRHLDELVLKLFEFLDQTEESDSGYVFHPIAISCCRALQLEPLGQLITDLKDVAYRDQQLRQMREMDL